MVNEEELDEETKNRIAQWEKTVETLVLNHK
jgi:hypothetical protein